MLDCDRQFVVPLATEAGLLTLTPACPPPSNIWRAKYGSGRVELPEGDVRRQHWWSYRVIQVKAAALLEAASGRDVPRLEAQRACKVGEWPSALSVAGQELCLTGAHHSTLLKWQLWVPLLPAECAGRPCPLYGGPVDVFGDHGVSSN